MHRLRFEIDLQALEAEFDAESRIMPPGEGAAWFEAKKFSPIEPVSTLRRRRDGADRAATAGRIIW
ncbi:MAG: hypothetical protein H7311_02285 [Ramlibacter sp.]|nr:hypothetical protein [Cryobacterium sp.]